MVYALVQGAWFGAVDRKALLATSGLDEERERRLFASDAGLWPPPTLEELRQP
jgi:hypothetical protein